MGHNRAGDRARARLRRRRREETRLAQRVADQKAADSRGTVATLTAKVKDVAKGVAEKVGGAVQAVRDKLKKSGD